MPKLLLFSLLIVKHCNMIAENMHFEKKLNKTKY